jgi:hypothetical protein
MSKSKDEPIEVTCPKCARRLKVSAAQASSAMRVRCKCGEDVALVKAML